MRIRWRGVHKWGSEESSLSLQCQHWLFYSVNQRYSYYVLICNMCVNWRNLSIARILKYNDIM